MLLAPGATCNGRLAAEEFHVLPTLAQRPAAAIRAQIAEPDFLCILIHDCDPVFARRIERKGKALSDA